MFEFSNNQNNYNQNHIKVIKLKPYIFYKEFP